jgi:hypothetical protein
VESFGRRLSGLCFGSGSGGLRLKNDRFGTGGSRLLGLSFAIESLRSFNDKSNLH